MTSMKSFKLVHPFILLQLMIFTGFSRFGICDKAFIEGDMHLVGLFDVFDGEDGGCLRINTDSVMVIEAVRWYTGQINKANVLPFRIGKLITILIRKRNAKKIICLLFSFYNTKISIVPFIVCNARHKEKHLSHYREKIAIPHTHS